jgi:hypothetical protein
MDIRKLAAASFGIVSYFMSTADSRALLNQLPHSTSIADLNSAPIRSAP